jgi:hypothetical protein
MKGTSEAYLDELLTGRRTGKTSPKQYIIDHQDELPLVVMVAYLDSIHERAVISDGRIIGFKHA